MGNEHRRWHRFWSVLIGTAATMVAGAFLFVAAIDPYDHLPVKLPIERQRVTENERYVFPGLIRSGRHDSAVFGTSTMMLLEPGRLSAALGGRFANLSMPSATDWEQIELMRLFTRHAPQPGTVVIGMDSIWCQPLAQPRQASFRPFPEWQYDDNPWNDYRHILNVRAIGHGMRQIGVALGRLSVPYGQDGYFRFVPPDSEYDIERARGHIYGTGERIIPSLDAPLGPRPADWTFPVHDSLWSALDGMAPDTRKILMFPPFHAHLFAQSPETWHRMAFCKKALAARAQNRPDILIVDFMTVSPITTDDSRYWDKLHYTVSTAAELVDGLRRSLEAEGDSYRVLYRPGISAKTHRTP